MELQFLNDYRKRMDVCNRSLFSSNQSIPERMKYFSGRYTGTYKFLFLIFISFLVLILPACEKVIDVDLNESEPAVVIEGILSLDNGELEVKISKTGSYFDSAPYEKVTDADVYLEGGPGFRLKAEETEQGLYRLSGLPLSTGMSYRLTVRTEGEEYTAVSMLNPVVKIDSLSYEYQREERFFDGGYRLLLFFPDPPESGNFYRIKIYRNDRLFNGPRDLIIFDDNNLNGKGIQVRLRNQLFAAGDTARLELYSIDRNTWEYFTSLRELINLNPGSPAPANPVSNFSNGALGYFAAWSHSTLEIIIPE